MLHWDRTGLWGTVALILAAYMSCAGPVRLVADGSQQGDAEPHLRDFQIQVIRYAALHRRLEEGRVRTMLTEPRGLIFLSAPALAAEIRCARPTASQGDLFAPAVADHFRRTIQSLLRNEEMEYVRRMAAEQRSVELAVNQPFPSRVEHVRAPWCLGRVFPPLPDGLEYHFAGRALLLWDVRAAIVVDYLPDAIPELTE